jgi:type IV secretory pathway TraG/TraD family ATPase VirD4
MIRSPNRTEVVLAGIVVAFDILVVPVFAVNLGFFLTRGVHGVYALVPPWTAWALVATDASLRQVDLVAAAGLLVGTLYLLWTARTGPGAAAATGSTPGSAAFGSARWRTGRELREGLSLWTHGAARNPAGLVVGAERGGRQVKRAWVVSRDGHILVIGAPGAGKSTRLIEPTLAVIAAAGEGVLVNDPKGELYMLTAGTLLLHGYDVVRFDLREPGLSVRWNPRAADRARAGRGGRGDGDAP